jgi:hypothetical protein
MAVVVVGCAAPAFGIPLLYVDTGTIVEVVDIEAGATRKIVPLTSAPWTQFSSTSELVAVGSRLYALAQSGPDVAVVAIDRERHEVIDTMPLVVESADPAVPARHFFAASSLRADAGGTLYMVASEFRELFFVVPSTEQVLLAVNPEARTVTAVPGAILQPRDPSCDTCSDRPPCLCESIPDIAAGGGQLWILRSRMAFSESMPVPATHADLLAIEPATGRITTEIALGSVPVFRLLVHPDGRTAYVATSGSVTVVDLIGGQVVPSQTFEDPITSPFVLAPDGLALYAISVVSRPLSRTSGAAFAVAVLDARPPFAMLRRLPLPVERGAFVDSFALSPDGTRVSVVTNRFRHAQPESRIVTIDALDGETVSELELRFPVFSDLPSLAFVDGCSDPTRCYCSTDSDCPPGRLCDDGACAGAEGCRYEQPPCFDGALCLLATTTTSSTPPNATTSTTIPGDLPDILAPRCEAIWGRLARLGGEVRGGLVQAVALPPGTEPAHYRRALRRVEKATRARIRAELAVFINPRPVPPGPLPSELPPDLRRVFRRFLRTTRACVGFELGMYTEVLERLRDLRPRLEACAATGG